MSALACRTGAQGQRQGLCGAVTARAPAAASCAPLASRCQASLPPASALGAAPSRPPPPIQPSAGLLPAHRRPAAAAAGATLLQAADARVDDVASRVTATYERNAAFLAEQVARQKEIHAQVGAGHPPSGGSGGVQPAPPRSLAG